MILRVTDQNTTLGNRTVVEVELLFPRRCRRPGSLQAEYDLASLGLVERVQGPYGDPPKWTVDYKEKVSVKPGTLIKPRA